MTANYEDIIDATLSAEMRRSDAVVCLGTRAPAQLLAEFGPARIRKTPIAEASVIGMAVGLGMSGFRPVIDLVNVTFAFVAFDQLANQAARMRFMSGGQAKLPLVLRAGYFNGTRAAAQHSQTGYALFAHLGGIKVVVPSSASEAGGLLATAIQDDNPVFMFESGRVVAQPSDGDGTPAPIPFGEARVHREGTDATVVAIGYMVTVAMLTAERLAEEGISIEVIDPRTLVPLDTETIRESVQRTGRLIVVDESFPTASFAAEIITTVVEDFDTFRKLQSPAIRVCTAPMPVPFSPELEDATLPGTEDIERAVRTALGERH